MAFWQHRKSKWKQWETNLQKLLLWTDMNVNLAGCAGLKISLKDIKSLITNKTNVQLDERKDSGEIALQRFHSAWLCGYFKKPVVVTQTCHLFVIMLAESLLAIQWSTALFFFWFHQSVWKFHQHKSSSVTPFPRVQPSVFWPTAASRHSFRVSKMKWAARKKATQRFSAIMNYLHTSQERTRVHVLMKQCVLED